VGASIGAAFYPDNGRKLQEIINLADQAMYDVKNVKESAHKNSLKFAHEINVQ
jgi:GGDEF domain-containing protein